MFESFSDERLGKNLLDRDKDWTENEWGKKKAKEKRWKRKTIAQDKWQKVWLLERRYKEVRDGSRLSHSPGVLNQELWSTFTAAAHPRSLQLFTHVKHLSPNTSYNFIYRRPSFCCFFLLSHNSTNLYYALLLLLLFICLYVTLMWERALRLLSSRIYTIKLKPAASPPGVITAPWHAQ